MVTTLARSVFYALTLMAGLVLITGGILLGCTPQGGNGPRPIPPEPLPGQWSNMVGMTQASEETGGPPITYTVSEISSSPWLKILAITYRQSGVPVVICTAVVPATGNDTTSISCATPYDNLQALGR